MRLRVTLLVLLALSFVFVMAAAFAKHARAECQPYPVGPDSPTGIVGCEVYGEGVASMWAGPGVARNDCIWPWTDCAPIRVTALDTGAWIEVRPNMFCDCYTGTPDQRIVDLDPPTVTALGLDPALGLWRVRVESIGSVVLVDSGWLPNTAVPAP